mmetsp:Transcript_48589/g.35763  ORF Transcript_48589/g.35763 Transcript_48589/m.35763 type:complete len:130 (-) Transcript_48589:357-746(-)
MMDLLHSISVLQRMVEEEVVDYRVVPPLMLGLTKLLQKKFNYLISESSSTLDRLKNPFQDPDQVPKSNQKGWKDEEDGRKKKNREGSYVAASKLFSVNSLHMPGLESATLNQFLASVDHETQKARQQMK